MTQLLRLAFPILLASVVSAVNHLTDRYFLAQAGDAALAAVLPAAMLSSLLTVLASTSLGYVESFIAQHHSSGDRDKAAQVFIQALYLVFAALPLFLLACPVGVAVLNWVGHSQQVLAAEKTYFLFAQSSGFFSVLSVVLGTLFTGQGRTRLVSAVAILNALSNILLDFYLIPKYGIAGAGLATILAGILSCLILSIVVIRDPIVSGNTKLLAPRPNLMIEILRFGLPSGFNALLGCTAFTIFTLILGRMGETELAASNIVFSFNNVFILGETALAQAITIAAARAYGKGGFPKIRPVVRAGLTLAFAFAALFLLVLIPTSDFLLRLFATPDANLTTFISIGQMLILLLIVRNLADAALTVYFGTLRGLGDTKFIVLVRTGTDILIWIPVVFVVQHFHPTITALWATMPIGILLSALLLGFRLHNQKSIRTITTRSST